MNVNTEKCRCGKDCGSTAINLSEMVDSIPVDQLKRIVAQCVNYNLEAFFEFNKLLMTDSEMAHAASPLITYVACVLQILKPILERDKHLGDLVKHLNKQESTWMDQHNIKQGKS